MFNQPSATRPGWGVNLLAVGVVFLAVLVPFLFWQQTWFGRALTDEELQKLLDPSAKPRKIQHALSQLSERITSSGPGAISPWYSLVGQLTEHPVAEVRLTVAWLMGQDNTARDLQKYLAKLLQDRNPLVRRNAALSLISFGNIQGRKEIRCMLLSQEIVAPVDGKLFLRLQKEDSVRPGTLVARIQVDEGGFCEVRSILPGHVEDHLVEEGAMVSTGQALVSLAPNEEQVWEALRAMYLFGEINDLAVIEPFLVLTPMLSERVRQQARFSIRAIKSRTNLGKTSSTDRDGP